MKASCRLVKQLLPLPMVSLLFDHMYMLEFMITLTEKQLMLLKGVADNLGHFLIALFTWAVVVEYAFSALNLFHMVLCGMIASLIDVDHFLAARSLKMKDAISQPGRPFLHNTSLLLLLVPFICLPLFKKTRQTTRVTQVALVVFTSVATHHLRDAKRRGLWLWPFGHTSRLSYDFVYILIISLIIVCVRVYLEYLRVCGPRRKRYYEMNV